MSNKTKVYKHFCIQDYKNNFSKKHLVDYTTALDGFMQMHGRLVKSFSIDKYFSHLQDEDEIQFEEFYEILSKWAVND